MKNTEVVTIQTYDKEFAYEKNFESKRYNDDLSYTFVKKRFSLLADQYKQLVQGSPEQQEGLDREERPETTAHACFPDLHSVALRAPQLLALLSPSYLQSFISPHPAPSDPPPVT